MFVTKMHLSRRTVLKGMGATLALPFLDAMLPAFSLRGQAAANRSIGSRRSMCRTGWRWSTGRRRVKGSGFELSPILEPLAPFRNQMLVLVGHQSELELHPRGRLRVVSHRHDARRPQRGRDHRRRVDGSAAREAVRAGDAGGVARARDGRAGQRRAHAPAI